jgi:acyl carrier protein
MAVEEQVRQFIVKNFYLPEEMELKGDTSLLDNGIVDSTGVLEVIAFLEEQFGVQVADEEMHPDNLDSISKIAAFVARKTG